MLIFVLNAIEAPQYQSFVLVGQPCDFTDHEIVVWESLIERNPHRLESTSEIDHTGNNCGIRGADLGIVDVLFLGVSWWDLRAAHVVWHCVDWHLSIIEAQESQVLTVWREPRSEAIFDDFFFIYPVWYAVVNVSTSVGGDGSYIAIEPDVDVVLTHKGYHKRIPAKVSVRHHNQTHTTYVGLHTAY